MAKAGVHNVLVLYVEFYAASQAGPVPLSPAELEISVIIVLAWTNQYIIEPPIRR